MTSNALFPRLTLHGQERHAKRVGWHAAICAVMELSSIDHRSRARVEARELEAAAAELRAAGEYAAVRILEKIKKITVILGDDGCLVAKFRGGKTKHTRDDRLERRSERRRSRARRRGRMIGR